MSELKPCPFCGGEAKTNDGGNSVYGRFWWRVGCPDCDMVFQDQEVWDKTRHGMLDPEHPPKECFEAWNTRAKPTLSAALQLPEVRALVEAMERAIEAIDAAYDGPDDNGAYSVRERAALAAIKEPKT